MDSGNATSIPTHSDGKRDLAPLSEAWAAPLTKCALPFLNFFPLRNINSHSNCTLLFPKALEQGLNTMASDFSVDGCDLVGPPRSDQVKWWHPAPQKEGHCKSPQCQ